MRTIRKLCSGLVLGATMMAGAWANVLVDVSPFAGDSFGQGADASAPAYDQSFVAPSGVTLDAIRWWGFHGAGSGGAGFDNFVVKLGGVVQAGSLAIIPHSSGFFDEYTLTVAPVSLTASSISVMNDSQDVEWYWQSAAAIGNPSSPDASAVAFSLIGHVQAVPEPATVAMMLAGLGVLGLGRKRMVRKQ